MRDEADADWTPQGAHLVTRVQTGSAFGYYTGDVMVLLTLWCHGVNREGKFVMTPEQARILAAALLDSAEAAEQRPPPPLPPL